LASDKAGTMVVRNALLCLKKGWSSEDFVSLNEKDDLIEDIQSATKNDSAAEFFHLRNVIFEKVSDKVKNLMKTIKFLTVTLDKVTVQRTSFTVILTYFFHGGKIHVVLNQLVKLTTEDYEAGTASMVVKCLSETLGLSLTELGLKLVHFVYDGVYATKEQRVSGGGCLSLIKHVATLLGLNPGRDKRSFILVNFR
jgi:hypothetical protein